LGGCPSLLVEPAATNLALRSEEFDDASWVKTATTTVSGNTHLSPTNALTADTLSDQITAVNATYAVQQSISFTSGTVYTGSVYAKNISRRYIYIRFPSTAFTTNLFAFFDLQLGVVVTQTAGVTATIQIAPDGFYRCVATATATITASGGFFIGLSETGTDHVYINLSPSSVIVFGAQLETGSVATSYIPTVAATATRNADVISKTGVSGFIGQSEGVVYAEVDYSNNSSIRHLIALSDNTSSNRIRLRITAPTTLQIERTLAGVNAALAATIPSSGVVKIAIGYSSAANGFVAYVNGSQAGVIAAATATFTNELTKINIGSNSDNAGQLNDRIRAAAIYPTRLTNAQLASLTTL
jgi:hypothetical protein